MAKWWPFRSKPQPIPLEALVAPAGSTVLLKTADALTDQQIQRIREALDLEHERTGVKFFLLFGSEWEATVIGATE